MVIIPVQQRSRFHVQSLVTSQTISLGRIHLHSPQFPAIKVTQPISVMHGFQQLYPHLISLHLLHHGHLLPHRLRGIHAHHTRFPLHEEVVRVSPVKTPLGIGLETGLHVSGSHSCQILIASHNFIQTAGVITRDICHVIRLLQPSLDLERINAYFNQLRQMSR